jgi:hypothetical protein
VREGDIKLGLFENRGLKMLRDSFPEHKEAGDEAAMGRIARNDREASSSAQPIEADKQVGAPTQWWLPMLAGFGRAAAPLTPLKRQPKIESVGLLKVAEDVAPDRDGRQANPA